MRHTPLTARAALSLLALAVPASGHPRKSGPKHLLTTVILTEVRVDPSYSPDPEGYIMVTTGVNYDGHPRQSEVFEPLRASAGGRIVLQAPIYHHVGCIPPDPLEVRIGVGEVDHRFDDPRLFDEVRVMLRFERGRTHTDESGGHEIRDRGAAARYVVVEVPFTDPDLGPCGPPEATFPEIDVELEPMIETEPLQENGGPGPGGEGGGEPPGGDEGEPTPPGEEGSAPSPGEPGAPPEESPGLEQAGVAGRLVPITVTVANRRAAPRQLSVELAVPELSGGGTGTVRPVAPAWLESGRVPLRIAATSTSEAVLELALPQRLSEASYVYLVLVREAGRVVAARTGAIVATSDPELLRGRTPQLTVSQAILVGGFRAVVRTVSRATQLVLLMGVAVVVVVVVLRLRARP